MKRKIGRLCMVLGAVLILCAAGLLGYNRWDAARAEKASQEVLGELEQTMQKTITEHQQENETAAPQPVLDPTQEMTTVEVEGRDYIGVLSIPAVERELPVMAQWSYAGLKIAPGRYSGTTYGDDLVICGHNYAMHFSPIKWLTEGAQLFLEDDVLTSGSGGLIPQGIVIGSVASIQSEAGGQTEYGIIQPAVDLDTLVQVFIIKEFDVTE